MNFTELQELLRAELRRLIERGSLSVTLLAKKSGLGQGHLSNFIKGRPIRDDSKNKILRAVGTDIRRLLPPLPEVSRRSKKAESQTNKVPAVPVVLHQEAIFDDLFHLKHDQEWYPFQPSTLAGFSSPSKINRPLRRFVAIRLDEMDVRGMQPVLMPGAVLLLDRHYRSFKQYPFSAKAAVVKAVPGSAASDDKRQPHKMNLYAIRSGQQLLIRYAEFRQSCLILRPFEPTEAIEVWPVKSIAEATALLVGRVALVVGEILGIPGS